MNVTNAPDLLQQLVSELRDPDEAVQHRAVSALGKLAQPPVEAVPALLACARAADRNLRCSAWRALQRICPQGSPLLRTVLTEALHDPDHRVVRSALIFMKTCGALPGAVAQDVVALFQHPHPGVRTSAAAVANSQIVLDISGAHLLRGLRRALRDPAPAVRERVLGALARVPPAMVTSGLVRDIAMRTGDERRTATAALRRLADFGPRVQQVAPETTSFLQRVVAAPLIAISTAAKGQRYTEGYSWDLKFAWWTAYAILRIAGLEGPGPDLLLQMLSVLRRDFPSYGYYYLECMAPVLGWIGPRLATGAAVLVGLLPGGETCADPLLLAALLAIIPDHELTIVHRDRMRSERGAESVDQCAALAGAFRQSTSTPAARVARVLAIIEHGRPLFGPVDLDWPPLWSLNPFLIEVLVADGSEDPAAQRVLAEVADSSPREPHLREIARAALKQTALDRKAINITGVLAALLVARRVQDPPVPGPVAPHAHATLADATVSITLTFARGAHYCCMEWGCHVPLRSMWGQLRAGLQAIGRAPAAALRARVVVVVEADALFHDRSRPDPDRRGDYAFAPAAARRYRAWVEEPSP